MIIGCIPVIGIMNRELELAYILKTISNGESVYDYSYNELDLASFKSKIQESLVSYKY